MNRAGSGDATKTLTIEKKEREFVSTDAAKSVEQSKIRKMHKTERERLDKNNEKERRRGLWTSRTTDSTGVYMTEREDKDLRRCPQSQRVSGTTLIVKRSSGISSHHDAHGNE